MNLSRVRTLSAVLLFSTVLLASSAFAHGGKGRWWKKNFTDKQKTEYMKLKLDYMKKKLPLKAKKKQLKSELVLLIISDKPDKATINKKLDEMMKLKREMKGLRVDFKLGLRKILTPEQRVKFDIRMMKKAMRGKRRGRGWKRGHRRHRGGYGHHGYHGHHGHHGKKDSK